MNFCPSLPTIPSSNERNVFVDSLLISDERKKLEELTMFVDLVLKLLGWVLSMKDNQLGDKVKFLGFIIDSTRRRFQIAPSTCQKTRKMIEMVIEKCQLGQSLLVSDLQSLTGKLMSLRLSIPSMSVWLRDVYFCFSDESCTLDPETTKVELSSQARKSLLKIRQLILDDPSSPFVAPLIERDVFVDSGECGWGATVLGLEVWGTFESSIIGKSSTFRELTGLLLMMQNPSVVELIQSRTVRFNLDSKGAIVNLLKSGPVRNLSPLVQKAWNMFDELKIVPTFRWVRRDTDELKRVDLLSKKVSFSLKKEVQEVFTKRLKCEILSVDHNDIANVIAMIVARKLICGLLIPRWEGKSWWSMVQEHSYYQCQISFSCIKFSEKVDPGWEFLIVFFR